MLYVLRLFLFFGLSRFVSSENGGSGAKKGMIILIEKQYCREAASTLNDFAKHLIDTIGNIDAKTGFDPKVLTEALVEKADSIRRKLDEAYAEMYASSPEYTIIKPHMELVSGLTMELYGMIISHLNEPTGTPFYKHLTDSVSRRFSQFGLYIEILFLKMMYNIALNSGQSLNLLLPAIVHLQIFGAGLFEETKGPEFEISNGDFNDFVTNYSETAGELIDRCLEGIKEHDLVDSKEQIHEGVLVLHNSFKSLYKPMIKITGAKIQNSEF